MAQHFEFDNREAFLEKLRELAEEGIARDRLRIRLPFAVPEAESLLAGRPSRVRAFALAGGVAGFGGGMAFTIYTAISWPLTTGGKPIVSLPPFILISYLLTILFGSLVAFGGFLLLARLPSLPTILLDREFSEHFLITVEEEAP